jgi:CspA family cold shock protein
MLITDCSAAANSSEVLRERRAIAIRLHPFWPQLSRFWGWLHQRFFPEDKLMTKEPMTKGTAKTSPAVKPTGILKWLNELKGFGLITPDDGSKDLFANFPVRTANDKPSGLKVKQRVSYTVQLGPDGDQAVNVKTIA